MKKSSFQRTFDEAVTFANMTQHRYSALGAAGTQNVRNPLPMNQLVPTVLNTATEKSAKKRGMTADEVVSALTACGYIARRGTVNCSLNTLKIYGFLGTVPAKRRPGQRGMLTPRFFLRKP